MAEIVVNSKESSLFKSSPYLLELKHKSIEQAFDKVKYQPNRI